MIPFDVMFSCLIAIILCYLTACFSLWLEKKKDPDFNVKNLFIIVTTIFLILVIVVVVAHLYKSPSDIFKRIVEFITQFHEFPSKRNGFYVINIPSLIAFVGPGISVLFTTILYSIKTNQKLGSGSIMLISCIEIILVTGFAMSRLLSVALYSILIDARSVNIATSAYIAFVISLVPGIFLSIWAYEQYVIIRKLFSRDS